MVLELNRKDNVLSGEFRLKCPLDATIDANLHRMIREK